MANIPSPLANDEELGRAAADRLCHEWPHLADLVEVESEAFAAAAVKRLGEIMESQPAWFQASRRGSELGAESLSAGPFQGILETIQNADDLAASEVRIAIRSRSSGSDLLIVHNGSPVSLFHVGAMVLPWVGTKADDPRASGRFGIGQMTLRALGGPIEAHCPPFHFRMEETPIPCAPEAGIEGFYDPRRRETLLSVPLERSVNTVELREFVADLGTQSIVFLRSIRRLSCFDLEVSRRVVDHHLQVSNRRALRVRIGGQWVASEAVTLSSPRTRQSYLRYMAEIPVSQVDRRRHKAAGGTTPIGVSIPDREEAAGLYDRVPIPISIRFPVGLNAQFDPDTARSTLHQTNWNKNRFQELGEFLGEIAVDVAALGPPDSWAVIPLDSDVPDGIPGWITERLRTDVVAAAQSRVRTKLRLSLRGERVSFRQLVYEDSPLDGLLTDDDLRRLAPDFRPMLWEWRDPRGRWRAVLDALNVSHRIETSEALKLLDLTSQDLGARDIEWFIDLADAALGAAVFDEWAEKRGVVLANGERTAPPRTDESRSLVTRDETNSLSSQLGVSLLVHPGHLEATPKARRVREALESKGWLVQAFESDRDALELLARGTREPIRLADETLLALRDAFERLSAEEQRELGQRIGRNVLLRSFSFNDQARSQEEWERPTSSYLPKQIDRERDSFAWAAANTPGLNWVSNSYAKLLKRAGGRQELGAQRFLVALGAQTQPRLVPPLVETQPYVRDPRRVSAIQTWTMPELQVTEIESLGQRATHLIEDKRSPDLEAVVADIQRAKPPDRRRRASALLAVLARGWDRHYAGRANARAVWGYDGYWNDHGEVTATWLARLASEPWLPSMTGVSRPPKDLHLLTEANKLTIGDNRALYLMRVDDQIMRSPLIRALRIRTGPAVSSIVSRLEELRNEETMGQAVAGETRTAYLLLALSCPSNGSGGGRPVDDITVAALRSRFSARGSGRGNSGLLYINSRWYRPRDVFRGPPMFGSWRPFVAESPRFDALWSTLEIEYPTPRDGIEVIKDLSVSPLSPADRPVVIETMRLLSSGLDEMTPQLRRTLRSLPLWDGDEWVVSRPVYALEDDSLAEAISAKIPLWQPGFDLRGHGRLLEALGVTLLTSRDFKPVVGDTAGAASVEHLRPQFALAVEHLRSELARRDPSLYASLGIRWEGLAAMSLVVDPDLEIAITVGGKRLVGATGAHLIHDPLTLFVRSELQLGHTDAGGRAISDLFEGDKQKVAWAWVAMWNRALEGISSEDLALSSDQTASSDGGDRLLDLKRQAQSRGERENQAEPSRRRGSKSAARRKPVEVRKLKDLAALEAKEGVIVNKGAKRGGILLRPRRPLREKSVIGTGAGTTGPGGASKRGEEPASSVPPPMSEREQLAYDAVKAALRLEEGQIADLRKQMGIGADAIDELKQFFEIKMASSAEIPDEVTLTPAEAERARADPDFFLAVVAGLEESAGVLRVRFIFDPLACLPVRLRGDLTLGGIRDAEALEFVFRKN